MKTTEAQAQARIDNMLPDDDDMPEIEGIKTHVDIKTPHGTMRVLIANEED